MPLVHAVVLGIVQGLSEFLPISSSGHLRLVPWLLGWNDFAAGPHLEKTFDVALHLGTLVGAIAYFRHDLLRIARGGLSTLRPRRPPVDPAGTTMSTGVDPDPGPEAPYGDEGKLAWLLLASAVPAAVLGAIFNDKVDELAKHEWLIGLLLIVFGGVLLWADRLGGRRTADTFGLRDAVIMGSAQALALAPGVSRSGATITAGRWVGLDRDAAARLSFLMSLPIIAGALLLEGAKLAKDGMPHGFGPAFAVGIAASAITGYAAVWGTLRLIRTRTFTPFVVYRVLVGAGVLVIAASSFR
jgi:undecaprenyl-diphosphatase